MRRALGLACCALLMAAPLASGIAPRPIEPVPPSAFQPYVLPDGPDPTRAPGRAPAPVVIVDTFARPTPRPRPAIEVPAAVARVVDTPAVGPGGPHRLSGEATWYCNSDASRGPISRCMAKYPDRPGKCAPPESESACDFYAAAGPRLRVAMGGGVATTAPDPWRNRIVTVCGRSCVRVKLADWCACQGAGSNRIIDLYRDPWGITGSDVTVSW